MCYKKKDFRNLIARAKEVRKGTDEDDPSCSLLDNYIKAAEDVLPEIKKNATSH